MEQSELRLFDALSSVECFLPWKRGCGDRRRVPYFYGEYLHEVANLQQQVSRGKTSSKRLKLGAVLPHRPTPAASGLELGHQHTPPPCDTLALKLNTQKLDARNQCLAAPTLWTTLECPVADVDGPAQ